VVGGHNVSPQLHHVIAYTPAPSAELHGAWGSPSTPDAPQGPGPCCYPFPWGWESQGSPLAPGISQTAPILGEVGCPQGGFDPLKLQHGRAYASSKLTWDRVRGKTAQTSWLPLSTSGLQLGVCRAVSPVPSGNCLILLSVSLQKSVCVFFFIWGTFFFFPSGCVRPVAWRQASYSSLSFSVQISSLSFIHTTKP